MSCCGDEGPCFPEFDHDPEPGGPGGRLLLYAIGGIVGLILLGALMTRGKPPAADFSDAEDPAAAQIERSGGRD